MGIHSSAKTAKAFSLSQGNAVDLQSQKFSQPCNLNIRFTIMCI